MVDDNFWKCFKSRKPPPWNWNFYLWPLWVCGCLVRYLVVFPFRVLVLALAWTFFAASMLGVQSCCPRGKMRQRMERARTATHGRTPTANQKPLFHRAHGAGPYGHTWSHSDSYET